MGITRIVKIECDLCCQEVEATEPASLPIWGWFVDIKGNQAVCAPCIALSESERRLSESESLI